MTEKEKMLRQLIYDANYDQELIEERRRAKDLCHEYNHLKPSDEAGQHELMLRLLGRTSGDFCIIAPFWCDYGYNIEVGKNFFANHNTVILDAAKVTFGDNVFVAPNCGFYTAGHPIDAERRNAGLEYAYPITVYGDKIMNSTGTGTYRDANGNELVATKVISLPGDEGYDAFGDAVPVVKMASA